MNPNPALRLLGFGTQDRVAIIHADDIGMCQATITAYRDLVDFGLLSSAAVMTPCPWFQATADLCRALGERADMGVHLTLTSEWATYRWGPLTTREVLSGLVDDDGCFYRTSAAVQESAEPVAVHHEVRAQVRRALDAGIDVTHVDTHMGSILHPKFFADYARLGQQYGLPVFALRLDEAAAAALAAHGMDPERAAYLTQQIRGLEEEGFPLADHIAAVPLDVADFTADDLRRMLADLQPGLTHFILHPATDTPELRAIAGDWRSRVAQLRLFTDEAARTALAEAGIQVIGYRALRSLTAPAQPDRAAAA